MSGQKIDYRTIRDRRIRAKICGLTHEMFAGENENGEFPSTEFMWRMETYILARIRPLRTFIEDWGGHGSDCACFDEGSPRTDCTCGYEKAKSIVLEGLK